MLERSADAVKYVKLNVEDGLSIETADAKTFDGTYPKVLTDYPPEKAARLYVGYSRMIGATTDALKALGALTEVTEGDIQMATAKTAARQGVKNEKETLKSGLKTGTKAKDLPASSPSPKAAKKIAALSNPPAKTAATKKAAPAKKPAPTKAAATKTAAPKKVGDASKRTAAHVFREHIRAGKLTDDQIFDKVAKEFDLPESKRGYVKWYRNDLRKKGEKVPDAK